MRRAVLTGLAIGAVITALCHAAQAQSCRPRSYSYAPTYQSYPSYTPSYYYSAPAYEAPKVVEYKAPVKEYKAPDYFFRFVAFYPVFDVGTYGVGSVYQPPNLNGNKPPVGPGNGNGGVPSEAQRQPGAPDAFQTEILKRLDAISGDIKRLDVRVEAIEKRERTYVPPPDREKEPKEKPKQKEPKEKLPPPGKEPPIDDGQAKATPKKVKAVLAVNAKFCAACHSRANAPEHGNDFVVSEDDGRIVKFTDAGIRKMNKHLLKKDMPPADSERAKEKGIGQMAEPDRVAWYEELDEQAVNG